MRVTLTCLDSDMKFWKWPNSETLSCIVNMSEYKWLEAGKACNQLARDEWAVVSRSGPQTGDNFAHYRLLDRKNQLIPVCSHSHDTKPKPPTWYLTLFSARKETDIFESDLNIDRLFRSEEGDGEAGDARPLVPAEESASAGGSQ
jgi:hypothetical protein